MRRPLLPLLGLVALLAGCDPGVRWRLGLFEDALTDGKARNKLTFVYFRSWASVECTSFEEQVLKQKAVLEATAELVCVPLEIAVDRDRKLAERWGIAVVPAFGIVDPDGVLLETGSANITRESLLAAIERARSKWTSATRPAPPP